ncbi:MAG: D-hexose-6-phosphate mutarotase [Luteolibacter sp.]
MTSSTLHSQEIPGIATFSEGPCGLVQLRIQTPLASALIYPYGAHIAAYQPAGAAPVIFTSSRSQFEKGKPIRGGVPVIFPWFGPRENAPLHGLVRTLDWDLESLTSQDGQTVEVVLKLSSSDATRAFWPHDFNLRLLVTVGSSLTITLEVENPSSEAFQYEEAFHTYFSVGNVRDVTVTGLSGATYIDKQDGFQRKLRGDEPVTFTAETEEFYVDTTATCEVIDPALGRRIVIGKSGSTTTVVWNPWIAKAAAMPDFADDEWSSMVCVETANAGENLLTLAPGETHRMTAEIFVK